MCHDATVMIIICMDFLTVHQHVVPMQDMQKPVIVQQYQTTLQITATHCLKQVASRWGGVAECGQ